MNASGVRRVESRIGLTERHPGGDDVRHMEILRQRVGKRRSRIGGPGIELRLQLAERPAEPELLVEKPVIELGQRRRGSQQLPDDRIEAQELAVPVRGQQLVEGVHRGEWLDVLLVHANRAAPDCRHRQARAAENGERIAEDQALRAEPGEVWRECDRGVVRLQVVRAKAVDDEQKNERPGTRLSLIECREIDVDGRGVDLAAQSAVVAQELLKSVVRRRGLAQDALSHSKRGVVHDIAIECVSRSQPGKRAKKDVHNQGNDRRERDCHVADADAAGRRTKRESECRCPQGKETGFQQQKIPIDNPAYTTDGIHRQRKHHKRQETRDRQLSAG